MTRRKIRQFEFTIIAGELKGRRITAPDLGVTRPPLSRLRKSIFDYLQPYLDGATYLDLFSGTGSYLFEAVSRGVASAVGVEQEARLADAINHQAEKLNITDRLHCLQQDVFDALPHFCARKKKFDLVMVAPPQYEGLIDRTLEMIVSSKIVSTEALIICQHDSARNDTPRFTGYPVHERRKYGNTTFTVYSVT